MSDFIISALVLFGIGMLIRALLKRRKRVTTAPTPPPVPTTTPPPTNMQASGAQFCPQCGTPLTPGSAFCANCGAKLQ